MQKFCAVAILGLAMAAAAAVSGGAWDPLFSWPVIPIHMVLTPEGKVVAFGSGTAGAQGGRLYYSVWDPALGTGPDAVKLYSNPTSTDIFCASQVLLSSGKALLVGGDDGHQGNAGNAKTTLFDGAKEVMSDAGFTMAYPRWYPTVTTLPSGEVLVQGGKGDGAPETYMITPEIFNPETGWRSLFGATSNYAYGGNFQKWWYPRSWVLPDGRVFGLTGNAMYYLNYADDGHIDEAGAFPGANTGKSSTAVMYAPGKILELGGGWLPDGFALGTLEATLIDVTGALPKLSPAAPLHYPRHWANSTLLPDGTVLVTGGSQELNTLNRAGPSLRGEIWNPVTDTWTVTAPEAMPRLYHSSAMLLPDGTVLSAGGGAVGPMDNLNGQVFRPPYLFNGDEPAARPSAEVAGKVLGYGSLARILVKGPRAARVTLVKTGAVTHSFNNEQRFLELPFRAVGHTLLAQMPASPLLATPGYYLLFVLDAKGVPSVGKIVQLLPARAPDAARPETADLVADGGFEASPLPAEGITLGTQGLRLGGWRVAAGSVAHLDNAYRDLGLGGASGNKCLNLAGRSAGTIAQTIGFLQKGAVYNLTFDYAKDDEAGERAIASLSIADLKRTWSATNAGSMNWNHAVYRFTARSDHEELSFSDGSGSGCHGMLIDNVAIVKRADPLPSPLAFAFPWRSGFGGLDLKSGVQQAMQEITPARGIRKTLTLAARILPRDFRGTGGIFGKDGSRSAYGLRVAKDGRLAFSANRGWLLGGLGGGEWYSNAVLKSDQWQHVAVSYDGTWIRFYVNGMQDPVKVRAAISFTGQAEPVVIGCDSREIDACFHGTIADAEVYDEALSASQIRRLAFATGQYPTDAVADLLPWNGGTGGVTLDDGRGYLQIPSGPSLNVTHTLTLAARVQASEFGAGDGIIVKGATASPYALTLWDNRSLRFTVNAGNPGGASGGGAWNSARSLVEGSWHHVAVTYDGESIRFYIDGLPGEHHPAAKLTFGTSDEPLFIGANFVGGAAYFRGRIADAKVFNRALSLAEIRALAGLPAQTEPVLAGSESRVKMWNGGSELWPLSPAGAVLTAPIRTLIR